MPAIQSNLKRTTGVATDRHEAATAKTNGEGRDLRHLFEKRVRPVDQAAFGSTHFGPFSASFSSTMTGNLGASSAFMSVNAAH